MRRPGYGCGSTGRACESAATPSRDIIFSSLFTQVQPIVRKSSPFMIFEMISQSSLEMKFMMI